MPHFRTLKRLTFGLFVVVLLSTMFVVQRMSSDKTTKTFNLKQLYRTNGTGRVVKWTRQIQNYSLEGLEFPNMPNPCPPDRHNKETVEDILCMKRPSFLSNYKNPCWFEDKRLRCLPYFHIIGVPKSATTDLYHRLTKHPDIVVNRGHMGKETWFWSWKRYGHPNSRISSKLRKFTEFVDRFNAVAIEKKHVSGYHPQITGHGDPMDFTDFHFNTKIPQNDPQGEELVWTTPYLIKHVNPGVNLVLMLRDPVERLYSYYFFNKRGMTTFDFDRDVKKSLLVWFNCTKFHSHRHCLYDVHVKKQMKVSIYSSFYSSHLKEWLKVFPRQQILILRTEDYEKDRRGTLGQLFKFLNITMLSNQTMDTIAELPKSFVTSRKTRAGPMLAGTKQLLVQLYRNSTMELAKLLHDERFAFKDVSFS